MKNYIVRAFVLTLAVAGFASATVASHARTTNKASVAPLSIIGGSPTMCLPSNPTLCGLD